MAETLLGNKKARFNFELTEDLIAGIELLGHEVKALKQKQGSLDGAYVGVRGNEAFLIGAHIPPYQSANTPATYDPYRSRRLLLTKKEIKYLADKESEKGLTIVPVSVYNAGRMVKVKIAVARGKKQHDKRETLRKRDMERELGRTLKS